MSDLEDDDRSIDELAHSQLRLVSYGMAVSGGISLLVAVVSSRPGGIVTFGLGGLAIAMLVFERLQGGVVGMSLGILVGSIAAWLWPSLGDGSYFTLGALLITVGVANTVLLPHFYRLGQRLGQR